MKKRAGPGVAASNLRWAKRSPTAGEITGQFGCFTSPCSQRSVQVIHSCPCRSHTDDCPGRPRDHHTITAPSLPQPPQTLSLAHYLWNNNAKTYLIVTTKRLPFPLTLIGIFPWISIWGKTFQPYWFGNRELPTERGAYSRAWVTDLILVSLCKKTENDMLDFQS